MRSGKLVIAEGGGPTAVINQSLVGVVLEARLFPQIERIYGARYGVRGIPTLLIFKDGKVTDQVVGFVPQDVIEEKVKKLLA